MSDLAFRYDSERVKYKFSHLKTLFRPSVVYELKKNTYKNHSMSGTFDLTTCLLSWNYKEAWLCLPPQPT